MIASQKIISKLAKEHAAVGQPYHGKIVSKLYDQDLSMVKSTPMTLFLFFVLRWTWALIADGRMNVLLIAVDDLKPMLGC